MFTTLVAIVLVATAPITLLGGTTALLLLAVGAVLWLINYLVVGRVEVHPEKLTKG